MGKSKDVTYDRYHPAYLLASWFWVGRLPHYPGLWGTLASLPLWWLLLNFGNVWLYAGLLFTLFVLGSLAIEKIQATCGPTSHDASVFVIDEVVGMGLALWPLLLAPQSLPLWGLAVLLFRVFDVLKPPPANWVDTYMKSGRGVMLDDVIAGIYAAAGVWVGGALLL
jgi:phosphatidylglycerophosphatase A